MAWSLGKTIWSNIKNQKNENFLSEANRKNLRSIINISQEAITISCEYGRGAIDILELQPESKCQMTVAQYINGYPVQKGEVWQ